MGNHAVIPFNMAFSSLPPLKISPPPLKISPQLKIPLPRNQEIAVWNYLSTAMHLLQRRCECGCLTFEVLLLAPLTSLFVLAGGSPLSPAAVHAILLCLECLCSWCWSEPVREVVSGRVCEGVRVGFCPHPSRMT